MNPYRNLPTEQRLGQRIVDQFNADAQLWRELAPKRRRRRRFGPRVSRRKLKHLDLLEFAQARPPQDCIGHWVKFRHRAALLLL